MFDWLLSGLDRWHSRRAVSAPTPADRRLPVTVVTGASEGIGLAIARRFATSDRAVLLVARDPAKLAAAAKTLSADLPAARVFTLSIDVTRDDAASAIRDMLAAHDAYQDILVNNAGAGSAGRFDEADPADLDRVVDLNVGALARLTRQALPEMLARGRGGVINIASLGGFVPGPYQATYYASKAFVISLSEALAAELAGLGVRVMAVAPGPIDTAFHQRMGADRAFYRWWFPGQKAESVAEATYVGYLLWQRVVVPGLLPKVLAVFMRVLPHAITVPMVAWLLEPRRPRTLG